MQNKMYYAKTTCQGNQDVLFIPLNYWLTRFVRRKDGTEYPPNTLHQIVCGVQRFMREVAPDLDLFSDKAFSEFKKH